MKTKVLVAVVAMVGAATLATAQRGPGRGMAGCQRLEGLPVGALDAAETAGVLFTREEEKLARDVYLALFEKWQESEFARIAASEQRHMDAVKTLLDRHELVDPVGTNPPGVFSDARLAAQYAELVARGKQSRLEALQVGALIEEMDIHDLDGLLAGTDEADLKVVYENIGNGSRHHLRAFVQLLASEGVTYTPRYLSAEEYSAILAAGGPSGKGWRNGGRRGGGQGGNGLGDCTGPQQGGGANQGPGQGSGQGPAQGGNGKGPGRP